VIITNAQPYVRKVQVGAMEMNAAPFLFNSARSAVVKQFGSTGNGFSFAVRFVDIAAGVHPLIPYVLRGHYRGRRRRDREAGQHLAYPALIMNMTVH